MGVCLDLCAAPGGWLQVAAKYMPVSSIIIGVDLFPIRPIRNVITLKEDIRTAKCRHEIKKNLKGWKVDVCIHDGAPNLGSAWAQDAYGQNTLTLAAVGLAVDFLREGGTFVTKVFRSSDYNSLVWVFNQLFKKVTVTKPPASRGTSAEIFAVCEGFLAPKQLDPRFLDPKHVFKELDQPAEKELYYGQKRAKRHREGYEDGAQLLFKQASVKEFILSDNPTSVLVNNHRLEFDESSKAFEKDRRTTPEIVACCEDIQVLGRKEVKDLLRWRLSLRKRYNLEEEKDKGEEEEEQEVLPPTLEEEEKQIDEEIEQKLSRAQQKKRQKLKKERKKQAKAQRRIDMKMDLVGDSFDLNDTEEDLFALKRLKSKTQVDSFNEREQPARDDDDSDIDESDSDSDDAYDEFLYGQEKYNEKLEDMLEAQYKEFINSSKKLQKIALQKSNMSKEPRMTLEMMDLQEKIDSVTNKSEFDSDSDEEEANPLIVTAAPEVVHPSRRASQWFSQSVFNDIDMDEVPKVDKMEDEEDDDDDEDYQAENYQVENYQEDEENENASGANMMITEDNEYSDSSDEDSDDERKRKKKEGDDFEVVPAKNFDDEEMNDFEKAELLAMGSLIKTGKLKLSDLIDDGFNRYAFNDDDLPEWFEQEERQHSQPALPVTKEMTREILENNKAINARPIKKVAEAKARKKLKAKRKIDKVKKRANHIAVDNDLSETAKARAIEKLYKQQMAKMKTKQVYVVRKKFQKGLQRIGPKRSVGTKVKVVDKRMKADKRAATAQRRRQSK